MKGSAQAAGHHEVDRFRRNITTPEGVSLPVQLADPGERLAAFIIDFLLLMGTILVLTLVFALGFGSALKPGWEVAAILLISFLLRSFYFIFFELRWQGTTPGKRIMGLRVIDNSGGPLRSDAVVARNLMREVEVFLPLSLLGIADYSATGGWVNLLTLVWASIFALMPLFNKDRMRVGDIVGGTWVIVIPKSVLLPDLAASEAIDAPEGAPAYSFSQAQLDTYGIYELQVLEDVLRQHGPHAAEARAEVCRRIQRKINWNETLQPLDTRAFLEAFYTALRARLEKKMLLGVRRESKHDVK